MKDKLYHVLAGLLTFFVGMPVYQLAYDAATDTHYLAAAIWATIVSAFAIAITKEFCDCDYIFDVWHFDWKDIGFTMIGAVLVALFIAGLHFGKG